MPTNPLAPDFPNESVSQPMKFAAAQKHLFYMELAKLTGAGFGIREAAAVMLDNDLPAPQPALLKSMNEGLDAGRSITDAFTGNTGEISDLERDIIGVGERGGRLASAFQHLAGYFGLLASVRREAARSMIYPAVLLHFGVAIGIVPTALMGGQKTGLEILAEIFVTLVIIYAVTAVMAVFIRAILRAARDNPGIDRALNRIPFLGKARRNMAMARFTKVYHTCVLAGLSISEAVKTSSGASNSGEIREAGLKLAENAKAGNTLGSAFVANPAFPKAFARSYATAEESGTLDKDLERWAGVFQTDAENSAKTLSIVVPKFLYFLIVAFVLWKILGFYSGYFSMLDGITE